MSNVVDISPPKRILVCECGCASYTVIEDGTIKCSSCGSHDTFEGLWFNPPEEEMSDGEPFNDVSGNGSMDFVRRHVISQLDTPEIRLLIANDKIRPFSCLLLHPINLV